MFNQGRIKKGPGPERIVSGRLGVIYSCAQPAGGTRLAVCTQIIFMSDRESRMPGKPFPSVLLPSRGMYRLANLKLSLEQMRMWS